ncbi:MAG: hypothetical protein GYA50_06200 [Eubacteriaceae bacterium]|nr:hypothetical protein [Eubacteriaceae bacterium]
MNDTKKILNEIKSLFLRLGFQKIEVNDVINYVYGNTYCIPHCLQRLGFLIEYADSLEEAQKNWYEDGDSFPLEMGEEAILAGLEKEIRHEVFDKQQINKN